MVESVGVGLVQLEVDGAAQRIVDGLEGNLVGRVVDLNFIVGHVRSPEVTEEVGGLNGDVLDDSGHVGVLDGGNSLVQERVQAAGSNTFITETTANLLLFLALSLLPLGADGGGDLIFAADPLGLEICVKMEIYNDVN